MAKVEKVKKPRKPVKPMTKNQALLADLGYKANKKLLALEKKKLTTPASAKALKWVHDNTENRTKFATRTKRMSWREVRDELYQVKKFLAAKSSTMTGHNAIIKKRNKTYEEKGISKELLGDTENTGIFYDFFKTKLFYKLRERKISSEQIVDMIVNDNNMVYLDLETMSKAEKKKINDLFNEKTFPEADEPDEEEEDVKSQANKPNNPNLQFGGAYSNDSIDDML